MTHKTLNKLILLLLLFLTVLTALSLPAQTWAVCPMCTAAVGAGLGVTRFLGIDDTIAGVWIGAVVLSSSLWLASWVKTKDWNLPKKEWLAGSLLYLLLFSTLYLLGIAGNPVNTIFGIDKIVFGVVVGTLIFAFSTKVDHFLRTTNEGQVYVYYQKVILPMLFLSITSFILHFTIS